MIHALKNIGKLKSVFIVGFMLTMGMALTSYVDSSFIENFMPSSKVGLLFALASFITLISTINLPKILEKFGAFDSLRFISSIYVLSIIGLVTVNKEIFLQIIFLSYFISAVTIYLIVDIIIEHYSDRKNAGNTRGIYLTIYNLAFLIGPFIAGLLIELAGFKGVYLLSGFFVILMTYFFISEFKDLQLFPARQDKNFLSSFTKLLSNNDLRGVYFVGFTLNFFFALMTIYMPIFLHDMVGLEWKEIGLIFALMHIPYILFEIPWGKLADNKYGEKEIMSIGIIIISISTILIGVLSSDKFWFWALMLAITRVGASMIQVTTESYFFKKIDKDNTDMISIFRNTSPISLLIGPVIATIILTFATYQELFIILGAIVMLALVASFSLKDTK